MSGAPEGQPCEEIFSCAEKEDEVTSSPNVVLKRVLLGAHSLEKLSHDRT